MCKKSPKIFDLFPLLFLILVIIFCLLPPSFLLNAATAASEVEDLCMNRACYPAIGNLLIGRKHKLSATSTCGLREGQRYCIVSDMDRDSKCFWCNSMQSWSPGGKGRFSHRIESVVKENNEEETRRNWWHSENGIKNVTISRDLEAKFNFTRLFTHFRSFELAKMFIERSNDLAKLANFMSNKIYKQCHRSYTSTIGTRPFRPQVTGPQMSIYRYFAYVCSDSFSGNREGPPRKICTRKYSDNLAAPSTVGEKDADTLEIAELSKITNLRINFTKLRTLGNDSLNYSRPEIDQKYWYAIYEMVVHGSCSCNGHAQRCIPATMGDEFSNSSKLPNMVHAKCECNHNTKGLNCDECQDFYNDSPWRPANGEQSNECKKCECNDHAIRCHFDWRVYNASGFTSGGVCDDCQHNTMGKNCQQCKPYFYTDNFNIFVKLYIIGGHGTNCLK